jgi:hypothetical protein
MGELLFIYNGNSDSHDTNSPSDSKTAGHDTKLQHHHDAASSIGNGSAVSQPSSNNDRNGTLSNIINDIGLQFGGYINANNTKTTAAVVSSTVSNSNNSGLGSMAWSSALQSSMVFIRDQCNAIVKRYILAQSERQRVNESVTNVTSSSPPLHAHATHGNNNNGDTGAPAIVKLTSASLTSTSASVPPP